MTDSQTTTACESEEEMSETTFAMTDEQIQQWIDACNSEPARQTLRHYLAMRNAEPDWWYCDIDPDESGDSPYEAMFQHRPRLTPIKLHSSYVGPTKWGVLHPSTQDDGEEAKTFDTQEEAQKFCDEWKEKQDAA